MDLSSLKLDDKTGRAVMTVLHPVTGDPMDHDGKPVTITLASADSDVARAARRAGITRRLANPSSKPMTADDLEKQGLHILAACTLEWSGIIWEGKAVQCGDAEAVSLYTKLPWLREQVDAFVSNRANFLPASSQG
jgi:hypothetical protein